MPAYLLFFAIIFASLFHAKQARAYPEFIGYKYSSCMTCHYNGQGNGPLTDYGRGVWAAEIAGRLGSGKKSAEEISEGSGFLWGVPMPWWLRPGIKARNLAMQTNPPAKETRTVLMQLDTSVAIHFDEDQKYIFVASYGYAPVPQKIKNDPKAEKPKEWISREHYFRWQTSENLWLYFGMTDKVYGIRIVDHTAFSRLKTGIAQNDQTHGVIAQYIQPTWEFTLHGFGGNMFQETDLRQKGVSFLYDYEIREAWRVGLTGLASSNTYKKNTRYGLTNRYGFGEGSALLYDLGLIEDVLKGQKPKKGYYFYSEAMQKLVRGYHLFFTGQAWKADMSTSDGVDTVSTGVGLLMFPMHRFEFRFEVVNSNTIGTSSVVTRDTWQALAQIHLSL
ncbi:MAG: hypothetical protein AB7O96_07430 [Pseudobdellovibrionaceae bacterium]